MNSPSNRCDVIVVGMGPAGATAAYELSRAGVSVIGLEKETHPRYKVCGGGLSARIEALLGSDFHSAVEQTIHGIEFSCGGQERFSIDSVEPIAYMVMRNRFDHLLVQRAQRAGTVVREEEPSVTCRMDSHGVEVVTGRDRYRAQFLVGADGANSLVARCLFPDRRVRRVATLESEIGLEEGSLHACDGRALVDLGANYKGYGWIFPKHQRLSVGVGAFRGVAASPKALFQRFVAHAPRLAGCAVPRPLGHPLPVYSSAGVRGDESRLVNGRALLVGDAGHLVDPLFGEGIYYAVQSGQLAARAILGAIGESPRALDAYEAAVRREIYPEFEVAARMADVVYTFPRFCHRLLSNHHRVMHLYYDVMRGRDTYQSFYANAKSMTKTSLRQRVRRALALRAVYGG